MPLMVSSSTRSGRHSTASTRLKNRSVTRPLEIALTPSPRIETTYGGLI